MIKIHKARTPVAHEFKGLHFQSFALIRSGRTLKRQRVKVESKGACLDHDIGILVLFLPPPTTKTASSAMNSDHDSLLAPKQQGQIVVGMKIS